jgi:RNA polymerase sigma-70 factor (ECF subfamily)
MLWGHEPDDAELVKAAWGGDLSSLGMLLERYRVSLYVQGLQILGSRFEAEDAVQETFLIALRKLDQVSEAGAVGGWLHQVLRNVCWMRLRTGRRELPLDSGTPLAEWATIEDSAEEIIDRLALRDWVWAALNQLPETLRVTALLRYFSRPASYSEIAILLGVPLGTVRSRLNQVRAKLADMLLEAAGLPPTETRELTASRTIQYTAAFDEMNQRNGCDDYIATFSSNFRLILSGGQVHNRRVWIEGCEDMIRVGVKIHLTNLAVSGNLLVLDASLENPPQAPFHCPPATTQIHFQQDGITHQMRVLHYALDSEQIYHYRISDKETS